MAIREKFLFPRLFLIFFRPLFRGVVLERSKSSPLHKWGGER